jgi:hypothetical protein
MRIERGLSLKDVGDRVRTDPVAVDAWEAGRQRIGVVMLQRLAQALNTDVRSFFRAGGPVTPADPAPMRRTPATERLLLSKAEHHLGVALALVRGAGEAPAGLFVAHALQLVREAQTAGPRSRS